MRDEFIELGQLAARNWFRKMNYAPNYGELIVEFCRWAATGPANPTNEEISLWRMAFEEEYERLVEEERKILKIY